MLGPGQPTRERPTARARVKSSERTRGATGFSGRPRRHGLRPNILEQQHLPVEPFEGAEERGSPRADVAVELAIDALLSRQCPTHVVVAGRSEEHTSELQ